MIIFFVLIVSSIAIFHIITITRSSYLQNYSQQYITFMQAYRLPMVLGNSYLQNILKIGNQKKIANQISQLKASFQNLQSQSTVI